MPYGRVSHVDERRGLGEGGYGPRPAAPPSAAPSAGQRAQFSKMSARSPKERRDDLRLTRGGGSDSGGGSEISASACCRLKSWSRLAWRIKSSICVESDRSSGGGAAPAGGAANAGGAEKAGGAANAGAASTRGEPRFSVAWLRKEVRLRVSLGTSFISPLATRLSAGGASTSPMRSKSRSAWLLGGGGGAAEPPDGMPSRGEFAQLRRRSRELGEKSSELPRVEKKEVLERATSGMSPLLVLLGPRGPPASCTSTESFVLVDSTTMFGSGGARSRSELRVWRSGGMTLKEVPPIVLLGGGISGTPLGRPTTGETTGELRICTCGPPDILA
mmetsp:Transcript_68369/g.180170  ORF Transcript_68369/g.180170 Transcript_68369/m.180170 type:complete len:331 (+) Transcript_68369:490-1482(+)